MSLYSEDDAEYKKAVEGFAQLAKRLHSARDTHKRKTIENENEDEEADKEKVQEEEEEQEPTDSLVKRVKVGQTNELALCKPKTKPRITERPENTSSSSEDNTSDSDSEVEARKLDANNGSKQLQIQPNGGTKARPATTTTTTTTKQTPEIKSLPRPESRIKDHNQRSLSVVAPTGRQKKPLGRAYVQKLSAQARCYEHGSKAMSASRNVPNTINNATVTSKLDELISLFGRNGRNYHNNNSSSDEGDDDDDNRRKRLPAPGTLAVGLRNNNNNNNSNNSGMGRRVAVNDYLGEGRLDLDCNKHLKPLVEMLISSKDLQQYRGSSIAAVFETDKQQVLINANSEERLELVNDPRNFTTIQLFLQNPAKTISINQARQKTTDLVKKELITRAWNASQLCSPVENERPCVMKDNCWTYRHFRFVMKEFRTPNQSLFVKQNHNDSTVALCLTCLRELLARNMFGSMISMSPNESMTVNQMFCNITNCVGEYMAEDCIVTAPENMHPVVYNQINKYRIVKRESRIYLDEAGYLLYTEQHEQEENKRIALLNKIEAASGFERGALL